MKYLLRFLLSPFTIIAMISAVGVASLMGTIIPQISEKTPHFFAAWQAASPFKYALVRFLQLDRIYTSVWFLSLIILITCSLSCSLYYQIKKALRAGKSATARKGPISQSTGLLCYTVIPEHPEKVEKALERVMRRRGYRHSAANSSHDHWVFSKNQAGRWGGVVFHLGLLCILSAGLWNAALRQRGLAILTVGESFAGQTGKWANTRTGMLARPFKPNLTIWFNELQPQYWQSGQLKTFQSKVTVIEQDGRSAVIPISVNHPGNINGIKLFLSGDYGYALDLLLNSKSPRPVLAHILLTAPSRRDKTVSYDMTIPTTAYRLHINFHPGRGKAAMPLTSSSLNLRVNVSEAPPLRTRLFPGQSIILPRGDTLTFSKVSYWAGIIFARTYGIPLLYAGFGLCITGAFLMYMLPVKTAYIQISSVKPDQQRGGRYLQQISISGRTQRYQALFGQELQEIAAELQEAAPSS